MAVNVQTTPEHRNRPPPPGWEKILWAPKKKYIRKPIRYQDILNENVENNASAPRTPPNRNDSSRSSTTPTFDKKPFYTPVILKFDDDDDE
uniref:Uncharacterized protein n=1 Tax=Panagrolaimus superbus TaxID=310955 RepID=A0A914Z419_9BILA